jgi:hypothetical protein
LSVLPNPFLSVEERRADALEDARLAVELDEQTRRQNVAEREDANRVWRAMMLAPTLEVCEALLAGESVPLERLDAEWTKRFGRRA